MKMIIFLLAMTFFSCGGKPKNEPIKLDEIVTITVKLQGEHVRFKQFDKNYLQITKNATWKDVSKKVFALLEFEEKWEAGECYLEGDTQAITDSYVFTENKAVLVSATELIAGIRTWEEEELVNLKIKGEVSYEIGFVDPVNGYIKERVIKDSFAISKYEVTYELWEKVYKWAMEEKEGEKYIFKNKGFCGGKKNADKKFVENSEEGKKQPVVKVSPRDAVIWCNAYSEMEGLVPVYYWGVRDDMSSEEIEGCILRNAGDAIKVDSAKMLTAEQAKKMQGKNGFRLIQPDEWELASLLTKDKNVAIDKYSVLVNGQEWFFTKSDYASGAKKNYQDKEECKRVAWFNSNSSSKTHTVGELAPNDLGLYDMSGNASEWCFGFNSAGYYLFRGGDWFNGASSLQVGYFNFFFPDSADVNLGFRIGKTLNEE